MDVQRPGRYGRRVAPRSPEGRRESAGEGEDEHQQEEEKVWEKEKTNTNNNTNEPPWNTSESEWVFIK
ncbi:hypothetical protein Y032_0001g379 [Ancylostoma ceylanicum]|uniref:Uncharacterized protein n=1 Tax=Ancylostoma ceylanicum TaxID=53326 RepID=A0A016W4Y1_9BILA|nr:hypothetical protein Y032_0001g379 [Ancylostoma ceylanicum]